MDKCFVAKLVDHWSQPFGTDRSKCDHNERHWCKLVDVRFPRRPPTFGVVYLSSSPLSPPQQSGDGDEQGLSLRLAILKLTGTNKKEAKFIDISQVQLSPTIILGGFDVANELQVDDDGNTSSSKKLNNDTLKHLQCVLVGHNGSLFEVNLSANTTDGAINKTTTTTTTTSSDTNFNNAHGKQLVVELRQQQQTEGAKSYLSAQQPIQCHLQTSLSTESSDTLVADKAQTTSFIHVLSGTLYLSYALLENSCVQLIAKEVYDLSEKLPNYASGARFARMLIVESQQTTTDSNNNVLGSNSLALIELTDGWMHVVERGICLHAIRLNAPALHRCTVLKAGANDPSTSTGLDLTLISLHDANLVGYSLQTSLRLPEDKAKEPRTRSGNNLISFNERGVDNTDREDCLLEPEPSFEMEMCWSIDLNDIDSIRSLGFNADLTDRKDPIGPSVSGCLCPIWSPAQLLANKSAGVDDSHLGWPKFLMIAYQFHLLLYSFEQSPQMPFSLVYDRAFINEISLDTNASKHSPNATIENTLASGFKSSGKQVDECVDVKLRPKLLHNYKLVGANFATDSLFNSLFLVNRIRLTQMRQLPQMGLLVAISSLGHVIALKLRSSKVDSIHKDNVYQQLVIDSLHESSSLLLDEIQRIESGNHLLRNDIESLEKSLNNLVVRDQISATSTTLAENFDRMLGAKLIPQRTMAGLYDLRVSLSSLIKIKRLIVTSNVSCMMLEPVSSLSGGASEGSHPSNSCTIESFRLNNDVREVNSNAFVLADTGAEQCPKESDVGLIKSYVCMDLTTYGPQNNTVTVPMFLTDSQQFGGSIQVHFVLEEQSKIFNGLMEQQSSLLSSMSQQHYKRQSTVSKYYTRSIELHPLESYSIVRTGESKVAISTMIKLRMAAKIEAQKWIQWLGECVPLCELSLHQNATSEPRRGHLESFFTHSLIDFEVSDSMIELSSDDFIVIELCKKHCFKRATNECIEIEIIEHTPVGLEHLRHVLASQHSNIERARQALLQTNGPIKRDVSGGLTVESLIDEDNLSQLPPYLFTDDIRSSLEGSLRKDMQEMIQLAAENSKQTRTDTSESRYLLATTLIDIAIGFLIDTLVDFDRMLGKRTATTTLIAMRSKLDQRYKSINSLCSINKFVDEILHDWAELNR